MRRVVRPLFLLAIAGIGGYLAITYRDRVEEIRRKAPAPPKKLPKGVSSMADEGWHWEKSSGEGPPVSVRAKNLKQIQEPNRYELEKVDLRIYRKDGKTFDHILSDHAIFDLAEKFLYCDGEADITMGVMEGEEPAPGRLIKIKSSGIRFDSATGKAQTDRDAQFAFEKGEGKSVGATYDPTTKELHLKSQVELTWRGSEANPRPMKVESGEAIYKETESKVLLSPWAKLTRENLTLEGKGAVVSLDKNGIRLVETTEAKGSNVHQNRLLEFSSAQLTMHFNEKSEVEKIQGTGNAVLSTRNDLSLTTTRSNDVLLEFAASAKESVLRRALANGNTTVESKPIPGLARPPAETRILKSETVEMKMSSNGEHIDTVDTLTPGTLEFLPNRPGQKRRHVSGERFHVVYTPANQIDTFHVNKATTRTDNEPRNGKPMPPGITTSSELQAFFAPGSGEMTRLEQWGDFRYEEGERRARSERALLDQASNRITLLQNARVSDTTGSTTADQILLDQKTEDFVADGNVQSSRLPDAKGGSGSAMLTKDQPMQARAAKMTTSDRQALVIYDGNAMLWQGSSRLQADRIEIDRKNGLLRAHGKVVSQILDQQKPSEASKAKPKAPAAPSYTLINAPEMTYSDKERLAHYTGGVFLRRDALDVKSKELRAYLKEEKKDKEKKEGESSLEKAVADGEVVIVQGGDGRTRRGASEHADYFVDDAKVILTGGQPRFEDSLKGNTTGKELIYFSNDGRLLVNGAPSEPAKSKVRRKPDASSSNKRN
ncbi:MAG: LPS export ABC transporter periplasmic protein LptC [Acidobacteria bacterium]|nr:LPS export ABC transporter periplasmic protein LptC [Acidobacteriota bacterium]